MKFDMHCHTKEGSLDARVPIQEYIEILKQKGFDGMLVTDHDSYRGYYHWLKHQDTMPKDFVVLKGIEYDTRDAGHFLVILPDGVKERLLAVRGMRVEILSKLVHHYGGVLGPAHPYGMRSASAMFFRKLRKHPEMMRRFDFLEGFNTCELISSNIKARQLAKEYDLPCVGGSDSHKAMYVGTAFTVFDRDITCNNDLIACIKERGIVAFGGKERAFLRHHSKRNWPVTTYTLKTLNQGVSLVFKPYRKLKVLRMGLYDEDVK